MKNKTKIVFTKHAKGRFIDFKKQGLEFTKRQVIKTIESPDHIDKVSDAPKIIISKVIDKFHVLRVVFKVVDGIITVITFYPAKRGRYYEDN